MCVITYRNGRTNKPKPHLFSIITNNGWLFWPENYLWHVAEWIYCILVIFKISGASMACQNLKKHLILPLNLQFSANCNHKSHWINLKYNYKKWLQVNEGLYNTILINFMIWEQILQFFMCQSPGKLCKIGHLGPS